MALELQRPSRVSTRLGPALRDGPRAAAADAWPLGRLAFRGMLGGVVLGLLFGAVREPTAAVMLLFGGLALAYLVVSFAVERPAEWRRPPDA